MEKEVEELRHHVERLLGSAASFLETVSVIEKYKEKTVWQGMVYVYRLAGHPGTDKCYAWYSDNPQTGKRKYYAVLHIPPIDSPEKAVRASIVHDHKAGKP